MLEAKNITFSYINGAKELFSDFNLTLKTSERLGLVAPSGFGKTTICKILAGYERAGSGSVLIDGKNIEEYQGYNPVQMIWQHPELVVNPRMPMKNVLLEGDNIENRIIEGLGIKKEWYNRYPTELSGGELQRFCIARALGGKTKYILADEITTMLDLITQAQIWQFLLKEVKQRNIGLLAVSHFDGLLDKICEGNLLQLANKPV